jgi:hypothetical protein
MAGLDTELETALKVMETSFHVRLIGTFAPDLVWAPDEADAAAWLAENNPDFDQFPVRQGDATVGILLRESGHTGKTVYDAMQPLREGLIVSADMPIADLIPQLRESHYRLILGGGRIDGLVTQSDLLKLPVRMLLFGLISHLELCLCALVRARAPWPEWLKRLESGQQKEICRRLDALKHARFEPDPLEFTNFSDVVDVLAQEPDSGDEFKAQLEAIRQLCNDIAHAKTYISLPDEVPEFADRFTHIRGSTNRVSHMLKAAQ